MLFDDYNFKLADRPKSNDMPTSKCDWTLLIKTRQEDNNKQHTTKFSMTRTYVLTRCDKVVITPHCIALSVYPIQVSCILDKLPKTQQLTFPLKSIKRTIFMSRSYIVCSETGEGGAGVGCTGMQSIFVVILNGKLMNIQNNAGFVFWTISVYPFICDHFDDASFRHAHNQY